MTCQLLFLGAPLLLVAIAQGLCIKYDWLHVFNKPLDLGRTFRCKRIFGDHKTWRGLLINTFFCVLGTLAQGRLQAHGFVPTWLPLLDYRALGFIAGLMLGVGMTFGELPNSFLKRQLGIPSGRKARGISGVVFFLLDQIDIAVGIWLCIYVFVKPALSLVIWSLLLTFLLHLAVSSVGYLLKMRSTIV